MQNAYQTLGVDRNATADEIKKAYRRLASQHHPDKGGDKHKFQEIQAAYDTLSDPQKRHAHDNPSPFGHPGGFGFRHDAPFDFETIFNIFGTRFQQPQQARRQVARMSLWITLRDVAEGGRRTITVGTQQGTQAVEVEIPAGIDDGDTVQYPGIGPGGVDLMITYRIHPDAKYHRSGLTLTAEHTVSIWNLILGGETQVRDILGNVLSLSIPANTQPNSLLRLRNRGIRDRSGQTGDLIIKLIPTIPDSISPELIEQIKLETTR